MSKKQSRISYSQLSMFSDCPLRWKLNYVDNLRISESNIYLIFGTAMHEVLQKYLEILELVPTSFFVYLQTCFLIFLTNRFLLPFLLYDLVLVHEIHFLLVHLIFHSLLAD